MSDAHDRSMRWIATRSPELERYAERLNDRNGRVSDDGRADGIRAVPFLSVRREVVHWLWPNRIPLGMLTLLVGDPGLGKSALATLIAAQTSRAGRGALIISAEDHKGATILPRLEATEADLDLVHHLEVQCDGVEDGLALPDDAPELDRVVAETGARLIVVDPLMAHLPERVNSWRDQAVRRALAPLHRIAEDRRCAVIVIAHLNKSGGQDPLHRTGGSIGIPAAVRSALLLARDPKDPDGELGIQRVLAHIKCNVGPQAESLVCKIDSVLLPGPERIKAPRISITGTTEATGSELLALPSGEERTERDEAMGFLLSELADGPRRVKALIREAPCGERTLRKAKSALGVVAEKRGFGEGWVWSLPEGGTDEGCSPNISDVQPSENPL